MDPNRVYLAKVPATYESGWQPAVRSLFEQIERISPGQRVVLKPNWVHHRNASGAGLDCLITHPSVIDAAIECITETQPKSILIGDAPVQGCDFEALLQQTGRPPIPIIDFRLAGPTRTENDYVRFNLGSDSYLEPISKRNTEFRVTMYPPEALRQTHGPANHQYLIARELLEADLVVNLPKLKTHKKAGITGALKNMVGANGHKSFLPHHRKGSAEEGGDCYAERNPVGALAENLLDAANSSKSGFGKQALARAAGAAIRTGKVLNGHLDVEGSWFGNDTVWRMVLDLQKIVCFGDTSGRIHAQPQRRIVHLTDAIIAGQGEGPLAPTPARLGLLTLGESAAACDWVHAALMGLDPDRIPLTRQALAMEELNPSEITVHSEGAALSVEQAAERFGMAVTPPSGWRHHCERVAC